MNDSCSLAAACVIAVGAAACSGVGPAGWIQVDLQPAAAPDTTATPPALSAFQVTVSWPGGAVATLSCPSDTPGAPGSVKCATSGFALRMADGAAVLRVRAVGYAFAAADVSAEAGPDAATASGAPRRAVVPLHPLPPAQNTADYATRLDGDGCLDALQELAIAIPTDAGLTRSVKFIIRGLTQRPTVYFQNTKRHPLHFDFAQRVLGIAGTADQFTADTQAADRDTITGTLIFHPSVAGRARGATPSVTAPWTLNFFPSDPITPEQVRLAHRLIEERLTCLAWDGPARRLVYLPAGTMKEDEAGATDRDFQRDGIGWMRYQDLFGAVALQALHPGVAYGTLKRMTPEQLASSVVSFRDILVLTRLPNELPLVGGTITEELQTPLAHVNVAARARGTPNLAYPAASNDTAIDTLIGKLVRFEVKDGAYSLREATLAEAEAFWASRTHERFVPTFDSSFTGIPSFAELGFADSVRVGAKAANLAELSRILSSRGQAPDKGLGVPFHYYESFMAASQTSTQLCEAAERACVSSGRDVAACGRARGLCAAEGKSVSTSAPESFAALVDRVLRNAAFSQDTALRDAFLAILRHMIEQTPVEPGFGALLDRRIAEVFGTAKVKVRSSTNAEDLLNFSGAGLYNSFGAHATGVDAASKVVTKVFASVWTFRAFEERSFWNIDHQAVRMGCVINQAFTDELANGVLITENVADPSVYGMYANVQRGEVSVTNPTNGALPEIFSILPDAMYAVARQRFSSLSPGASLLSPPEVTSLYQAGDLARTHFSRLYGRNIILEMEFKLTPEHVVVFKQARPYTTVSP